MTVTREQLQAAIADTIDQLVDLTIAYAAGQVHAAVVPAEQPQRGEPPGHVHAYLQEFGDLTCDCGATVTA